MKNTPEYQQSITLPEYNPSETWTEEYITQMEAASGKWDSEEYMKRSKGQKFDKEMLEQIINGLPVPATFVDFACGQGAFLFELEKKAKDMGRTDIRFVGFDPNRQEVNFARTVNKDNDVEIYWGGNITDSQDIQNAIRGLGVEKVDGVGLNNVLFFFPDDKKTQILKNLNQVLDIEGKMILLTREFPAQGMKNGKYGIYDTSRNQLLKIAEKAGFNYAQTAAEKGSFGSKREYIRKAMSLFVKFRELGLGTDTQARQIGKLKPETLEQFSGKS